MATISIRVLVVAGLCSAVPPVAPRAQDQAPPPAAAAPAADNPYRLEPFHADFPAELTYPNRHGTGYDKTRRQILERLCANLQGNVRSEAWHMATEFFWRAPDDAVEPLVETMDRAFGSPALADVVKNCVEAMGRMANERLEPALRRAAEHANANVRQAAFQALATCGTPSTLRIMQGWLGLMDARSRAAWLEAVRTRLGADAVPILRDIMGGSAPIVVRDQVLKEALQLPPEQAAAVLRTRWSEAVGEFKAIIAGVLHAAGDPAGTIWLQEALRGEDIGSLLFAIRHCARGELGPLRSDLLRLSTHERADIRHEVARALVRIDGDDVADVYEVLALPDEAWETRGIALRELTRRGRNQVVGVMLDELATASGTRLQLLLSQIAASGDPRCIPELVDRFRDAPAGEGRPFLQAIAQNASPAACAALLDLFRGPELLVARGAAGLFTTWNYVPTLLLNVRGTELQVFDAFDALDRADWRHRALLLPTLSGLAADRRDPALQIRCAELLRRILFDRGELPQLRLLALNLMTMRSLTVEDALRLANMRRDESPGMKALLGDFLVDYF
ncbi:MAG: HEAT repeat domain-containing protein [Planctomycetes bacterium]|nr:HEAT repeat domain-containing protein [Planctomycetota bacterium]